MTNQEINDFISKSLASINTCIVIGLTPHPEDKDNLLCFVNFKGKKEELIYFLNQAIIYARPEKKEELKQKFTEIKDILNSLQI